MYVHDEAGLTFLAQERTASRAVATVLKNQGFRLVGDHHDGPTEENPVVGVPFTVVRNHWDILVSFWYAAHAYLVHDPPITTGWLVEHFLANPERYKPGKFFRFLSVPEVRVLRYETLQDDLDALLMEFGLDSETLTVEGESEERAGRHYSHYYDFSSARFIGWLWFDEIVNLGYRFEGDD